MSIVLLAVAAVREDIGVTTVPDVLRTPPAKLKPLPNVTFPRSPVALFTPTNLFWVVKFVSPANAIPDAPLLSINDLID